MNLLTVLIVIAVILTIGVLFIGLGSMGHGGEFDEKHSDQLMFARVGMQALAILLLLVAAFMSGV